MACLKCGKKTKDEQNFCRHCLEVMEAYPVNPDVHVQLPNRSAFADPKKTSRKRKLLSAEEQVVVLRRRVRRLIALILALVILMGAAVLFLLQGFSTEEDSDIGKNYTLGNPFE